MTAVDPQTSSDTNSRARLCPAIAATFLCVLVIIWMGLGWDELKQPGTYRGKRNDYYSLLVHGFLAGHTYMDAVADPRLASPDPAVRATGAAPLDSSYYKGHIYLYFGVTPAAVVLLPYAWITGSDLDPRMAVALCVVAGFLFSVGIWAMAAGDHFRRPSWGFQMASVAALSFTTATPLLLTRAMFYELAIASGYACVMSGCFWIYRGLFGRGSAWLQFALAGLSFGLAVGCRPDLFIMLPALAAAALIAGYWNRDPAARAKAAARNLVSSLIPAACVGCALAIYNFERFGSPTDFGFEYGANGFIAHHFRLASATYVWPNIHWYFLTLPAISPYFPYVFPCRAEFGPPGYATGEAIHGQFLAFVLVAFVVLTAALIGRKLRLGRLAAYLATLAFMFLVVFIILCTLGIRADRYMVDFQTPLILGIVLLAGVVAARAGSPRGWKACFVILVLVASAFNIFAGIEEFDAFKDIRTSAYTALETIGNVPSGWMARMGLLRYGPIEIKVIFPGKLPQPLSEPLVNLGTPQATDSLYVNEYDGGQVELMGDHIHYTEVRSPFVQIVPGKVYTLKVEMGAFYPPLNHPFFARYNSFQARRMKNRFILDMDGQRLIDAHLGSYNAPPWTLELGRNDISMFSGERAFGGQIVGFRRLAPPGPEKEAGINGLWRIRCTFPVQFPGNNYPILTYGVTGNGTLVYVTTLPGNQIRFNVDEWGYGGGSSNPISVLPQSEHTLDIFLGTLAGRANWPGNWNEGADTLAAASGKLRIWLDGKLVQTYDSKAPFNPKFGLVDIGANDQGFSTSSTNYEGPIRPEAFSDRELREFLERNLKSGP